MGEKEQDGFTESANAPYWQQRYGIGHRWTPSARGKRGCMFMLYAGFAVLVLALLIDFIIWAIR